MKMFSITATYDGARFRVITVSGADSHACGIAPFRNEIRAFVGDTSYSEEGVSALSLLLDHACAKALTELSGAWIPSEAALFD